jgi:hypothetical protein
MRLIIILVAALSVVQISCGGSSGSIADPHPVEFSDLPADFRAFYDKFHEDSLYQSDGTPKKVLAMWEPSNWTMQRRPDMKDAGLKRSTETLDDLLVIERLQYPMVNYGLERHFYKDENKEWKLIFYSEMQELR